MQRPSLNRVRLLQAFVHPWTRKCAILRPIRSTTQTSVEWYVSVPCDVASIIVGVFTVRSSWLFIFCTCWQTPACAYSAVADNLWTTTADPADPNSFPLGFRKGSFGEDNNPAFGIRLVFPSNFGQMLVFLLLLLLLLLLFVCFGKYGHSDFLFCEYWARHIQNP